jgi:pyroglutamyl-peptidase
MKVLITGFDPFDKETINPSYEAIKLLKNNIKNTEIIKVEIPTVFKKSIIQLEKHIDLHNPDIIISVGQAGGRSDFSLERIAINLDDARIPDNEQNQPIDEKIFNDGDCAYFSNLPIKSMVKKIRDNGLPASISNTAGTFVCNHIMYGILYLIEKKYPGKKGGFIHVPYVPEQTILKPCSPSMSLDNITKCLELAIKAAVETETDIKIPEGKIH